MSRYYVISSEVEKWDLRGNEKWEMGKTVNNFENSEGYTAILLIRLYCCLSISVYFEISLDNCT